MKNTSHLTKTALLIMLLGLSMAQSNDHATHHSGIDFQLESAVLASGGSAASGGDFELNGTLGQPVAAQSSGDNYVLHSGFWATINNNDIIFRNGFE